MDLVLLYSTLKIEDQMARDLAHSLEVLHFQDVQRLAWSLRPQFLTSHQIVDDEFGLVFERWTLFTLCSLTLQERELKSWHVRMTKGALI